MDKNLVGKHCKLFVDINGTRLFYNATITGITDTHISFLDKFNKQYSYRNKDIAELIVK